MADASETTESAEAAEVTQTMVVADGVLRAVDVGVVDDDDEGPDAEAPDPSNLDPKR